MDVMRILGIVFCVMMSLMVLYFPKRITVRIAGLVFLVCLSFILLTWMTWVTLFTRNISDLSFYSLLFITGFVCSFTYGCLHCLQSEAI